MESNSFISSYHLILTSETAKYLTVILRDEEKLLWQRNICQHDSLNCKELVDCPAFFSWLNLWNSCCRRWKCFCVSCECRTAWGHTGWAQTWWTSCYLKLFLNRLNRRITSKTHKHFLIFKNSKNKNNWSHDRRPARWYGHLLFNLWLLQMYGGARGMRVRGQHLSELPWLSASSPPSTEEPRTASARPSWRPDSPWMHHADTRRHTHRSDLLLNDRVCLKSAWRLWSICISWYQSEWCECQITTTVAIKLFYIIR